MSITSHIGRARWACGTVAVAIALLASVGTRAAGAATIASAGPAAGKALGGVTKQGQPVTVLVSRSANRVSLLGVLEMKCKSGADFLVDDAWSNLGVRKSGAFHASRAVRANPAASLAGGGRAVVGRLDRKHGVLRGAWELILNYTFTNGQTDSCDSGAVLFAARL